MMQHRKVMLDLTEHQAKLVQFALRGLLMNLSDQWFVKASGFKSKECQRVMNNLDAAQIKFAERRWRDDLHI